MIDDKLDGLPKTLAGLAEIAVESGRRMIRGQEIYPSAYAWIKEDAANGEPECFACLAGAVLIYEHGAEREDDLPEMGDHKNGGVLVQKLHAINYLRMGNWRAASEKMVKLGLHTRVIGDKGMHRVQDADFSGRAMFANFLDQFEKQIPILRELERPVLPQ